MFGLPTVGTFLLDPVTIKNGAEKALFLEELNGAGDQVGKAEKGERDGKEDPTGWEYGSTFLQKAGQALRS